MAGMESQWRRSVLLAALLVVVQGQQLAKEISDADLLGMIEAEEKLLYPIHFSSMPLSTPDASSLETPDFGNKLAKIGLAMYKKYTEQILPEELKADKDFKEEFDNADHSRVNLAFLRWQKQAYSSAFGVDPMELTGRGEHAPKLKGIDYKWPEFYKDPLYKQLQMRLNQVSKLYLKRSGYQPGEELPSKLRIFPFVEVYNRGDSQRPWARTDGGFMMGRYFAQASNGALKFNFEDPRGINPPYGKTYSHAAYQGNVVMYPNWVSHFITPNMLDQPQVCFGFMVYPPEGNVLDYEEDKTGDIDVTSKIYIPADQNDFRFFTSD